MTSTRTAIATGPGRRLFALLALSLLVLALGGCVQESRREQPDSSALFYPLPPAPPRVQYLATFSGAGDVGKAPDDFATFVLGEEIRDQQLLQPYGVAIADGRLYAVDSRIPGLAVFDLAKQEFRVVRGTGSGRMQRPINITIDTDGRRYVTDTGRKQVLVFDRNDEFVEALGAPGQFTPVDVAIAGDRLYVVDIEHHAVQVLDKHTGAALFSFGKAGSAPGELFHPTNIAIGPGGDVYVVETSNFRVQRFSPEGESVQIYGHIGDSVGSFARPKGIAIDREGRMLVGDSAFENVQVFDRDGRLLMFFGNPEPPYAGLNLPAAVAIDYAGVSLFQRYAAPGFDIEYVILVASQFGPNKVDVFGFGKLQGADYARAEPVLAEASATPVQ